MMAMYTFTVGTVEEGKELEKIMRKHGVNRKYWDKSKMFNVGFAKMRNYTILTNEITFNAIVQAMGATRVY